MGNFSNWFQATRGLQQGNPVSSIYFILIVEWVLINQNGSITEMLHFAPPQNGGKIFLSCSAAISKMY